LQTRDFRARLLDLFFQLRAALHGRFFRRPDFFEIRIFPVEPLDFFLDQLQALLRRFVLLLLDGFALDLQLDAAAVEPVHLLGLRVDFHLDLRRRFVDQVDRLVRQEAIRDVAMRQFRRRDDRRVGNVDAVVQFIAFLQAAQDRDGRFDRRLVDEHFLEAALQRGILFDVLAVFVKRGRADAMQFAARQRRLQHVARVHRAFGLARADHRVNLVDEDDGLPFVLRDVVQHGLQTLFELTAVLCACEQRGHVERQHALALERLRHFAIDDALRETFDDRRLADARLTDQHRIVLGPALEDLNRTADFVVTADDRIELARARALGQIDRVFLQCFALAFGILAVHLRAAAHGDDGRFQRLARQPMLARETAGFALVVGDGEQEHFARDVGVVELLRLLVRLVQQACEVAADLHVAVRPPHLRQTRDRVVQRRLQRLDVDAGARQQRTRRAVLLRDEGREEVNGLDVLIVMADGEALRIGQRFLEFSGEFVDSHQETSNFDYHQNEAF